MEEQNNSFNPYTYMKNNFKVLTAVKNKDANELRTVGEVSAEYLKKKMQGM